MEQYSAPRVLRLIENSSFSVTNIKKKKNLIKKRHEKGKNIYKKKTFAVEKFHYTSKMRRLLTLL